MLIITLNIETKQYMVYKLDEKCYSITQIYIDDYYLYTREKEVDDRDNDYYFNIKVFINFTLIKNVDNFNLQCKV